MVDVGAEPLDKVRYLMLPFPFSSYVSFPQLRELLSTESRGCLR